MIILVLSAEKIVRFIANGFSKPRLPFNVETLGIESKKHIDRLEAFGITGEYLEKCKIGFKLFEVCEEHGWKDYKNELANGCLQIFSTQKSGPKHISVFFGMAALLIRHDKINRTSIPHLADWHANLIKEGYTPKQVQRITQDEYL